jgi:hypothetical protein
MGSVADNKRHKKSTIEIAAKEIAKFNNILVFNMSLRSPILFRCKTKMAAYKMTLFNNKHVLNDV